jgi:hypothetical protein
MPEISRFLGIVIGRFFNEHGPAHFHAVYGDHEITVEIESGKIQLLEDWERARRREPLERIAPLE